mmetsp:Transcript_35219/g.35874  ORF Transcript_35219/g.35874 Transcript_35219/m.35874 type:complete len:150 (+) Transcript_35219:111-560(+)|eukprot:CAMPEP_0182427842 /NCGR_PEP_ID=MMETSP1167-20130531/20206_1 /TAXON_ID=2988 /ORGANISM="Mallomonas Sp, Strain CCMP3275" /LENGTH=149 /DNA_ID=CAMNT_0024610381 /DNA_START=85 /DNA_END=534 /DNA_ORIENTATION=-
MENSLSSPLSMSSLTGGLGLKDRLANIEEQLSYQSEVNERICLRADEQNAKTSKSQEVIVDSVKAMQDRFMNTLSEMSKQNHHRFSLQESETKRAENQIMSIKADQNEMTWSVPESIRKIEYLESEIGVIPPSPDKTADTKMFRAKTVG